MAKPGQIGDGGRDQQLEKGLSPAKVAGFACSKLHQSGNAMFCHLPKRAIRPIRLTMLKRSGLLKQSLLRMQRYTASSASASLPPSNRLEALLQTLLCTCVPVAHVGVVHRDDAVGTHPFFDGRPIRSPFDILQEQLSQQLCRFTETLPLHVVSRALQGLPRPLQETVGVGHSHHPNRCWLAP